jgi:hypothetical protein
VVLETIISIVLTYQGIEAGVCTQSCFCVLGNRQIRSKRQCLGMTQAVERRLIFARFAVFLRAIVRGRAYIQRRNPNEINCRRRTVTPSLKPVRKYNSATTQFWISIFRSVSKLHYSEYSITKWPIWRVFPRIRPSDCKLSRSDSRLLYTRIQWRGKRTTKRVGVDRTLICVAIGWRLSETDMFQIMQVQH